MEQKPNTLCDDVQEANCYEKLKDFIKEVEVFMCKLNCCIKILVSHAERIFLLATKYNILQKGAPCTSIYPPEIVEHVETELLAECNNKFNEISNIIKTIFENYSRLEEKRVDFETATNDLDWKKKSKLIRGSEKNKPIQFFTTSAADITFYLHAFCTRMKQNARQLNLRSIDNAQIFQKDLAINEHFENYVNSVECAFNLMKLV